MTGISTQMSHRSRVLLACPCLSCAPSPVSACTGVRFPWGVFWLWACPRSVLCPRSDMIRCHHVASADEWRCTLPASDRWHLVAAPPGEVSWQVGGRALMARVGCRGTEDMSVGDFPCPGTGFGGMDPRSGRGVSWILTARR